METIKRKRGIYLLPNMITALSMFFGFLAIRYSMEARYNVDMALFVFASYAILAGTICDGIDGSVARLTKTQSAFGVQFDSMSDLISFGVAPAFVAYNFMLKDFGRLGFAAAFIYTACAALRLARFNVQSSHGKASGNFTGIPSPMAAAPIVVFILAQNELSLWTVANSNPTSLQVAQFLTDPMVARFSMLATVLIVAFGMISTFEYVSTKSIKFPKKYPFRTFAVALISLVLLFAWDFTLSLAILLFAYMLHGPIMFLFLKRDRGAEEEELFGGDEDEEEEA